MKAALAYPIDAMLAKEEKMSFGLNMLIAICLGLRVV